MNSENYNNQLVVLIAMLTIAIMGSASYILSNDITFDLNVSENTVIPEGIRELEEKIIDPELCLADISIQSVLSDWNEHSSEEFGIKFLYPSSFKVEEDTENITIFYENVPDWLGRYTFATISKSTNQSNGGEEENPLSEINQICNNNNYLDINSTKAFQKDECIEYSDEYFNFEWKESLSVKVIARTEVTNICIENQDLQNFSTKNDKAYFNAAKIFPKTITDL